MDNTKCIVFYDGVCKFCNGSVNALVKLDKSGKLFFSPLQGDMAKKLLTDADWSNPQSLVYMRRGVIYRSSSAVIYSLADASLWMRWVHLFRLLPVGLRNGIYGFIAENRYRWFGKYDSCIVPDESTRRRFLP
jgi:predicted DCC family thiol-disulfide oxidoreductase YuxK